MLRAELPAGLAEAAPAGAPIFRQMVLFEVDQHRVALPVEIVREVIPGRSYTPLPGSAPAVLGLMNLRGRIVTVLDFGTLLGLRSAASQPEHRAVIVEHEGRTVAVAVENLAGMSYVDPDSLRDSGVALGGLAVDHSHVSGVGEVDGEFFVAIDTAALLRPLLA